jgi:hypothetical protein
VQAWRALLSQLTGRAAAVGSDAVDPIAADPFARPAEIPSGDPSPLDDALDEIEAGALDVYAGAGLPTRPGHYRRAPNQTVWDFVAADLAPQARFALALEHPPETGWRFARLQDLGAASRLLNEIADLRLARRGVLTEDHLLVAMELGGAWRALRDAKAAPASAAPPAPKPRKTPRKPSAKPSTEPAAMPPRKRRSKAASAATADKPAKPG